jgi:hypothetical protein
VPVVNDGDTIADLVRAQAVGKVVPIGDDVALADTIAGLIEHPDARQALAARCRALAQDYTWEAVAQPVVAFCRQPRKPAIDARTASVALQHEVQGARRLASETTAYAERLEREIASRDRHIERTACYVQELEERVAHPSLRAIASARLRTTSLRQLANKILRRNGST